MGSDCILASAYNYLELYKWLYEIGIEEDSPISIKFQVEGPVEFTWCTVLSFFCRNGNLEAIQWLQNCKEPISKMYSMSKRKYVYKYSFVKDVPVEQYYSRKYFILACASGNIKLCEWLYDFMISHNILMNGWYYIRAFVEGCKYGYIDITKWLYKILIKNCSIEKLYNNIYVDEYVYYHIHILEWILNDVFDTISEEDRSILLFNGLIRSALHLKFDVLKWIYNKIIKNKIDIFLNDKNKDQLDAFHKIEKMANSQNNILCDEFVDKHYWDIMGLLYRKNLTFDVSTSDSELSD